MKKIVLGIPKDKTTTLIGFLITITIINFFAFLAQDALLVIGVVIFDLWGVIYGYFNYLRICKFTSDTLIIFGDFSFEEETKIQKSYKIKYKDIISIEREILQKGLNSDNLPYKKGKISLDDRYNKEQLECILFHLKDESKKRLIISHYKSYKVVQIEKLVHDRISQNSINA
jgi:hypothetical protein